MKLPTAALLAVTLCCSAAQARDKAIDTQFGMPERWAAVTDTFTAATPAATAGAGLTPQWWASFDDPVLDSLMSMGTRNNYDIATATRRVSIARTQVGTERAAYYPNVSVSAGYTYTRDAGAMHSPVAPSANTSYWDLGAQASWEIDVFGRVKDAVAAAKQNVRVSAADRAGVMLSVQSQIALTYIQLRVEQAQLVVAEAHSQRQDTALRIAEARFEAGIASMLDVDQAQQVYYSTVASIPLLEYNIHADINALSTLTGSPAGALNALLSPSHSLPDHVQPVATGVPADLLRNRPDVIAAERTIDMYASRLGIARKEWLPSISVQASGGTYAHDAKNLFQGKSWGFSVAPVISWTVFDGLSRKYAIQSAEEELQSAVESYNLTVLNAVQEADDALASYYSRLRYIKSLEKMVDCAAQYDTRSLNAYRSGLAPYINVANAQMTYLEDENTLIVAKGKALMALVKLYKALGGGYSEARIDDN